MCRSMVDIQSATAESRRGKKKKIEETTGQKYNVRIATQGGHNNISAKSKMTSLPAGNT